MSDMSSNRITVRISGRLTAGLRSQSKATGRTESDLVREALESYLGRGTPHRIAYDLAEEAGIIGSLKNAPPDLSASPRHFKGFGTDKDK